MLLLAQRHLRQQTFAVILNWGVYGGELVNPGFDRAALTCATGFDNLTFIGFLVEFKSSPGFHSIHTKHLCTR